MTRAFICALIERAIKMMMHELMRIEKSMHESMRAFENEIAIANAKRIHELLIDLIDDCEIDNDQFELMHYCDAHKSMRYAIARDDDYDANVFELREIVFECDNCNDRYSRFMNAQMRKSFDRIANASKSIDIASID